MTKIILCDLEKDRLNLLPFTYLRPISEIRAGVLSIADRWKHFFPDHSFSNLTSSYLQEAFPYQASDDCIFINSCVIADPQLVAAIEKLSKGESLFQNDIFIAARVDADSFDREDVQSDRKTKKISYEKEFIKLAWPWDIFRYNHQLIEIDFSLITDGRECNLSDEGNRIIGKNKVFAEEGVDAHYSIFNTTQGNIYLGKNSRVMEGSMIQGPFSLGSNSQLKMGTKIYPGTSIGNDCKVGGELNNVVMFGYSNKAHEGFLGNAVIGEWCNIGADSNNSNLKNTYEEVKVWNYSSKSFIKTGLQFCGLFMGDHSKCGINTMFNTGTTVGISANIFGAGFPRTFIPSFSWGGPHGLSEYKLDKALNSIELMMSRRNLNLEDTHKQILSHIFDITKEYRH